MFWFIGLVVLYGWVGVVDSGSEIVGDFLIVDVDFVVGLVLYSQFVCFEVQKQCVLWIEGQQLCGFVDVGGVCEYFFDVVCFVQVFVGGDDLEWFGVERGVYLLFFRLCVVVEMVMLVLQVFWWCVIFSMLFRVFVRWQRLDCFCVRVIRVNLILFIVVCLIGMIWFGLLKIVGMLMLLGSIFSQCSLCRCFRGVVLNMVMFCVVVGWCSGIVGKIVVGFDVVLEFVVGVFFCVGVLYFFEGLV